MIPDPRALLLASVRTLMRWQDRAEQRRVLAELDERALADIGIPRREALSESMRPFWSGGGAGRARARGVRRLRPAP